MCIRDRELPVQIKTALKTGFELLAFPNPFTDIISVKGKIKQSSNYRISLYNMEGKIMAEKLNYFIANNEFNMQLKIEQKVPPGIYLLSLSSSQGIHGTIRVIKY